MRFLKIFFTVSILWVVFIQNVIASGCGCSDKSIFQSVKNANTIFIGEISEAHSKFMGMRYRLPNSKVWIHEEDVPPHLKASADSELVVESIWAKFVNVRVLKGSFDSTQEIRMGTESCLMKAYPVQYYVIVINDELTTSECIGSKDISRTDVENIKTLEQLLRTYKK